MSMMMVIRAGRRHCQIAVVILFEEVIDRLVSNIGRPQEIRASFLRGKRTTYPQALRKTKPHLLALRQIPQPPLEAHPLDHVQSHSPTQPNPPSTLLPHPPLPPPPPHPTLHLPLPPLNPTHPPHLPLQPKPPRTAHKQCRLVQ